MPITPNTLELQLKYTCQIAGARWAVWMELDRGEWLLGPKHSLGKGREAALRSFLAHPKVSGWLAGSLSGGRMRVRTLTQKAAALGCRRIFSFPGVSGPHALLVGADELGEQARGFFRVLALSGMPAPPLPESLADPAKLPDTDAYFLDLRHARNLSLIHHLVRQVVSLTDLDQISQQAAELMATYFEYEFAVVLLLDEAGERLTTVGVSGTLGHMLPRGLSYPANQGLTGHVLQSGESYFSNQASADPLYFSLIDWQADSEMCVPLRLGDRSFGVLNVERRQPALFSKDDLLVLESLAGVLSSVLMNAKRYQQLQQLNWALQENVNAQQLAESRLIRSARLAAVGEMAAGVAHELNNPLTTVTGFVELVLEELPPDSPQRADLELVLRESRRARSVVHQLLDFSRPQEDVRQHADLNLLVQETLSLLKHWTRTRAVQVSVILAEDLPAIYLDANQIKQVLVNLVHNGLQSMPHGGELTIQTGQEALDGRAGLMLKVRDNGEGISPEILERLFEPFFTTRPPGSGTGLGLSVSYGIVSNHGGVIEVESQVGVGSLFTVWLPLEASEARDA
ncbi:MAG TPA: ATP-binding protein [Anaerolineales bacterium]|nr:ATP-binding protein [Anaerolineales bacterium]